MKKYFIKSNSDEYQSGTIWTDWSIEDIKDILIEGSEIKEIK